MTPDKPQTIVELTVENLKKVRAARIRPDGHLVVIGGANGAGKSSVLDAIEAALGGLAHAPDEPVRRGAEDSRIVVEFEDLIVERTFKADGGAALAVRAKDGAKYPSPQTLLDGLVGRLSFDPLEFARLEPTKQAETLKRLAGLDLDALDAERRRVYDARTEANREERRLAGRLAGMPIALDPPAAEVDVAALSQAFEEGTKAEAERASRARQKIQLERDVNELRAQVATLQTKIEAKLAELAGVEKMLAAPHQAANLADLRRRLAEAQTRNEDLRRHREREAVLAEHRSAGEAAATLDRLLNDLDARRAKALAEARFPVPGLGFDERGVILDGLPFAQASQAERLRVSVAMGLALNPQIRVLLVRDGSLLDEANLGLVAEMARDAGAQVWVERVGRGREVTVLLEDGEVAAEAVPA